MIYPEHLNEIICGDCLDVLKSMPDKSVDLVLTDPPYGVNLSYDTYEDTEDSWFKLMTGFIPEARRVAKMVIMPSCQIKRLPWIYQNYPPDWLICWYKGSSGSVGYVGFNDWEPLLVYGKNTNVMHDYVAVKNSERMGNYGHPCPKPVQLARWLIERATKEGQIVCDPFCGSGTTCVAAKILGRKYIGIEISPVYAEIARKRVEQAQYEERLFAGTA
jgi:DNA modification methylase